MATGTAQTAPVANLCGTDPGLIFARESVSPLWIREFSLWFVNRRDYYFQGSYSNPAGGQPDSFAYRRSKYLLQDWNIVRHLCGLDTIALYALNPDGNTSKWFCLDVDDDEQAKRWLGTIQAELEQEGVASAFEKSRRGGHLWIFCAEPLSARLARIYLFNLLDSLGIPISGVRGNRDGVEINPKQDEVEAGQFGNGVRAPLGIHRKDGKRYWFIDAETNLKSQFAYLRSIPRLKADDLEGLTLGLTMPDDLTAPLPVRPVVQKWSGTRFNIHAYEPMLDKNKKKVSYFIQCPSCRSSGADTKKDNLHVTRKGGSVVPVIYCHAGCSFKEIRDACLGRR